MINVILTLALSAGVFAKTPVKAVKTKGRLPQNVFVAPRCENEFNAETAKRKSVNDWQEQAPTETGGRVFRTPTDSFGRWLEASYNKAKGTLSLFEAKKSETTRIDFNAKCKSSISNSRGLDFSKSHADANAEWIDDAALAEILKKHPAGLIYVWSPGMVYSVKFFKYFRDVAQTLNLEFVPILDPRASLNDVNKITNEFGILFSKVKLNSVELYMRNMTVHYPTSLVFKNGRLSVVPIIGVMEKDDLEEQVKNRLEFM